MSSTIRVSDELYEVIDDYRRKDETFQDVIERMAHEIGLLPSRIKDLGHLRRKLENLYGYEAADVREVLDALRIVYIGQESDATIGIPHKDVESKYSDELDALKRLGLVEEHHYTGKYDYGYQTTGVGDRLGSELVREHLKEREHELREVLDSYNPYEVALFVETGFNRSDLGHLSTRKAPLAVDYEEALVENEYLRSRFEEFLENLIDIDVAVCHSEGHFVVAPPEFNEYLHSEHSGIAAAQEEVEVYQALLTYYEEDLDTIGDLLDEVHLAGESKVETVVESLAREDLTSPWIGREDEPLLVKDGESFRDHLRADLRERLEAEGGAEDQ